MEKLLQLIPEKTWNDDFKKVLYAWWYAYVTDSIYWIRTKSNDLNEKWLEDWLAVSLSKYFKYDKDMKWKINLSIFSNVDMTKVVEQCDYCNWLWTVEWYHEQYTKEYDCPRCNWYNSDWYNPLDTIGIAIWSLYYRAKALHKILSILWEVDYWITDKYLYLSNWEYEVIINNISEWYMLKDTTFINL